MTSEYFFHCYHLRVQFQKLANRNNNINIFLVVCGKLYRYNIFSLYPSTNSSGNYTGIEMNYIYKKQNVQWQVIFTYRIINELISSITFNLWPDKWLSSPLPLFLFFFYPISATNKQYTYPNFIINLVTPILSLSVFLFWFKFYQGLLPQVSKTIHFLFELNFKMLIFIVYFYGICILFGSLIVL